MLFRTLGTLDFITVLVLIGAAILPSKLLFYAALYLLVKGFFFIYISKDLASYGDFFSCIYMLLLSYGIKIPYVHNIVLFYLIQKTFLTFVAIAITCYVLYKNYEETPILDKLFSNK
ncbi:MAG: hypothetical protein QW757_02170 [Candidatus Woesearchaeota archaeon]